MRQDKDRKNAQGESGNNTAFVCGDRIRVQGDQDDRSFDQQQADCFPDDQAPDAEFPV